MIDEYLIITALAILLICVILIISSQIKQGKIKLTSTHSYSSVIKTSGFFIIISLIICVALYMVSKSLEATISLFVFLVAIIIAACLRSLFIEYHIKKRSEERNKGG